MSRFDRYLEYVRANYGDFRYVSDRNSLGNIDAMDRISYRWIENDAGFALAFVDSEISESVCFFGYAEILGEYAEWFEGIREFARSKGCRRIVGPVNLSIWNSYRFSDTGYGAEGRVLKWGETPRQIPISAECDSVIAGSPSAILPSPRAVSGEYETDGRYHAMLLANGFGIAEEYLSVYRDGTNPFTHYEPDDAVWIERLGGVEGLDSVYRLSLEIFPQAPRISFPEFLTYMRAYVELYGERSHVFLLKRDGREIGFLSSLHTKEYFVVKTLGVLPEFRKNGYGNMLLDHVFRHYFDQGIVKSYGIYMKSTGDVLKMSHGGGSVSRKYFTYFYDL